MPFAGFDDWDECMTTMTSEEGHDEETAKDICGALRAEAKADNGNPDELLEALKSGAGLIADVGVDLVSGVDVPAVNSKWVMLKSGDTDGHDFRVNSPILLSKAADDETGGEGEEKRISYAAAMIPREPDKEGDVAPTATVEKAAHDFLKQDGGVDTDHSLIDGDGEVVESWILKEQRTFELPSGASETYDPGTWMVGIQWGAEPWERIKAGELTGLSIYGMAEHVPLSRAATCRECGESLSATKSQNADTHKGNAEESGDMGSSINTDELAEELAEPLAESVSESVGDSVGEAVKDALPDDLGESGAGEQAKETEESGKNPDEDLGDVLAETAERIAEATGGETPVRHVREALQSALGEIEAADDADDDEEGDEMEDSAKDADDVAKRAEEANLSKGYDGEGTREGAIKAKSEGETGGSSGLPSYRAVAEEQGEL